MTAECVVRSVVELSVAACMHIPGWQLTCMYNVMGSRISIWVCESHWLGGQCTYEQSVISISIL